MNELAPKLVAMSMGWMESENMMSEMARAMMNTSVGPSFFRRKMSTRRTSRFRTVLTRTESRLSFKFFQVTFTTFLF